MSDGNAVAGNQGGQNTARLVAIGILVVAVGAFIIQNTQNITVKWLFMEFEGGLWLMLLIVAAIGVAIGYFIGRSRTKARLGRG